MGFLEGWGVVVGCGRGGEGGCILEGDLIILGYNDLFEIGEEYMYIKVYLDIVIILSDTIREQPQRSKMKL